MKSGRHGASREAFPKATHIQSFQDVVRTHTCEKPRRLETLKLPEPFGGPP